MQGHKATSTHSDDSIRKQGDRKRTTEINAIALASHPAGSTLRNGALVVSECLFRREEAATIVAQELAHFTVLRHLMAKTVVLARKALRASLSAGIRDPRLRFVGFHMNLESVLARELTFAPNDVAREATTVRFLVLSPQR